MPTGFPIVRRDAVLLGAGYADHRRPVGTAYGRHDASRGESVCAIVDQCTNGLCPGATEASRAEAIDADEQQVIGGVWRTWRVRQYGARDDEHRADRPDHSWLIHRCTVSPQ